MSLKEIKDRHGRDRWKDAVFIVAAILLTALSIGSVTSKAAGRTSEKQWKVTLVDPDTKLEIGR